MFLSLFIFRGHSTREPASSRVSYSILMAYSGTGASHSQRREKSVEILAKMQVNGLEERNMYGYILTYSSFEGRTFKICVLTRWDLNFCVRTSPLRGVSAASCVA